MSSELYLAVVRLRIRNARLAAGLNQEEVADRADMAPRHYRRLEALTARKTNPTLEKLRAVALVLDVDVPALTGEPTGEEIDNVRDFVREA